MSLFYFYYAKSRILCVIKLFNVIDFVFMFTFIDYLFSPHIYSCRIQVDFGIINIKPKTKFSN